MVKINTTIDLSEINEELLRNNITTLTSLLVNNCPATDDVVILDADCTVAGKNIHLSLIIGIQPNEQ